MKQPSKKLTVQFVRNAKTSGKYFDGNGLFLLVKPSGTKSWVQRIMINGKRREIGLGSADLVSLADARSEALENRRLAQAGQDPLRIKHEKSSILTYGEAARKVYELHRPTWRNEKHAKQFISTLETYTFPKLGKRPISEISTSDVLAVLTPIWVQNQTRRGVFASGLER